VRRSSGRVGRVSVSPVRDGGDVSRLQRSRDGTGRLPRALPWAGMHAPFQGSRARRATRGVFPWQAPSRSGKGEKQGAGEKQGTGYLRLTERKTGDGLFASCPSSPKNRGRAIWVVSVLTERSARSAGRMLSQGEAQRGLYAEVQDVVGASRRAAAPVGQLVESCDEPVPLHQVFLVMAIVGGAAVIVELDAPATGED
jgi:hypothetical protein